MGNNAWHKSGKSISVHRRRSKSSRRKKGKSSNVTYMSHGYYGQPSSLNGRVNQSSLDKWNNKKRRMQDNERRMRLQGARYADDPN